MIDYMDLGATRLHETAARVLAKVDGLLGATAPREVREARPDAHGAIDRSRWLRERIVSLEGEVWGSSYDNAYDEFELVNEALVNTLKAPALLKWARPPGTVAPARQMLVKLASDVQGPLEEGARLLRWQAQLVADDPRHYSQTLRSVSSPTVSAGEAVIGVTNGGKIETPGIWRIYGAITNPRVRLDASGEEVVLSGAVAAGAHLIVDVAAGSVKLNNGSDQIGMLDAGASSFFEHPVGTSNVRLLGSATDAGAHLEVDSRDAWPG